MEIMNTTAVYNNTEMDDYNAELQKSGSFKKIVSLFIFSLVFVLGVLGNGVVIWVTGFKMKKNVNTVWYLNLAVADFLVTAFLPLRITYTALDGYWPFGKFWCKMDHTIFFLNMFASIYILVVISVDRCVCVVCPVWAQNHRSVRKASCVSLGVWVVALALSSPYFIFKKTLVAYRDFIWCYHNLALTNNYNLAATNNYSTPEVTQLSSDIRFGVMIIAHFLMGFVVPCTVIVSCYSVILYRLRNSSLASQSRRPFKIIAAVIATFFLCWAPYHIMYLIAFANSLVTNYSGTLDGLVTIGIPIATGLALLNSCLNPLLYVFMGQGFKDVFRRSILKVLEKAFAEELPKNKSYSNAGSNSLETALSDTQV